MAKRKKSKPVEPTFFPCWQFYKDKSVFARNRCEHSKELLPVMIPTSMWGLNARRVLADSSWQFLRAIFGAAHWHSPIRVECLEGRQIYFDNYIKLEFLDGWSAYIGIMTSALPCHYCETEQISHDLHELWSYDDSARTQTLYGLVPVCDACHHALHPGNAQIQGLADRETIIDHLASVNCWSRKEITDYLTQMHIQWRERSQHEYKLNLEYLENFIRPGSIHLKWLENENKYHPSRGEVADWAMDLLESDAVIIDTETTGLAAYKDVEIIEMAVIDMKGNTLFNQRFKPLHPIPPEVTKIHHITDDDVKDELPFSHYADCLYSLLHGRKVIAYNANFDRKMIERTCAMHGTKMPESRWGCAMYGYRDYLQSGRWVKLPGGVHNALGDCMAALKILKDIASKKSVAHLER